MNSKLKLFQKKVVETDYISESFKIPFNSEGSTHKSFIGGITSILINCIMIVYIVN